MLPYNDYHMHTPLCGHAIGEPFEYCEQAIKIGLKEIGFSDHAPFVHMRDPGVTMDHSQLPLYYKMIEEVRDRYKDLLTVKISLETDFIPGYEPKTKAIVDNYPFDYVIGSVHFIKGWEFDNPAKRSTWDQSDVNQVYLDYFELLRQSALSGMFNIIGHADLVKKFGHRATTDMTKSIQKNAEVFKATGVAVEINTSGLRKPAQEMYPALSHLKIYAAAGVPLTFGSDSHDPLDVGKDFDKAIDLAKTAGFKDYVLFKNRKIERKIKL